MGDERNSSYETAATHLDGVEEGLSYTLQVRSDKSGIIVNDNSDRTSEVHVDAGDTGFVIKSYVNTRLAGMLWRTILPRLLIWWCTV